MVISFKLIGWFGVAAGVAACGAGVVAGGFSIISDIPSIILSYLIPGILEFCNFLGAVSLVCWKLVNFDVSLGSFVADKFCMYFWKLSVVV